MNPNARISALESKLTALMAIIEKQTDNITELRLRLDDHDKRMVASRIAPLQPEYVPQFTQWPGAAR